MTHTTHDSDPATEVKSDEDNRDQFIANFDTDGTLAKFESQLKRVARELNVEIRKRQAVESSLQATVSLLEKENDRLRTKLDKEWRLPLVLFAVLSIFGVATLVLMSVYFATQFFANSEMSKRLDDLKTQVDTSDRLENRLDSKLNSFSRDVDVQVASAVSTAIESIHAENESSQAKIDGAIEQLQADAKSSQTDVNSAIEQLRAEANSSQSKLDGVIEQFQSNLDTSQSAIDDVIEQVQAKLDSTQNQVDSRVDEIVKRAESTFQVKTGEFDQLLSKHQSSLASAQSKMDDMKSVTAAAQEVDRFLGLAQTQLFYKQDLSRALDFAVAAESRLEESLKKFEESEGAKSLLRPLQLPIWMVQGECYLKSKRFDEVERVAAAIDESGCNCTDGDYFRGLASVHQAFDQSSPIDRYKLIDKSIASLESAVNGESFNSLTRLYLAAACFDNARYSTTIDQCDKFLADFPASEKDRAKLNSSQRGQVQMAIALKTIAKFILKEIHELPLFNCNVDVAELDEIDGILFEQILDKAIRNRRELVKSDWMRSNQFGVYCANVIGGLRRACQSEGNFSYFISSVPCQGDDCGIGIQNEALLDLYAGYDLFPIPQLPEKTANKELGEIVDGKLVMTVMRLRQESQTRLEEQDGQQVEIKFMTVVPFLETVEFDPDAQLPEDHYVKMPTEPEGAPLPDPGPRELEELEPLPELLPIPNSGGSGQ